MKSVVLPAPEGIYDEEWRERLRGYMARGTHLRADYWAFDEERFWRKHRRGVAQEMEMVRRVGRWMDLEGRRVLVHGSFLGQEAIAYALHGARVTAIDLDGEALELSRELARRHGAEIEALRLDARETPFPAECFDYVSSAQVLEHLPPGDPERLIAETWRVMKPGALLWIDTPNQLSWKDHHDTGLPFIHWLPRRLKVPLARALGRAVPTREPAFGFEEVGLHHYLSWPRLRRLLRRQGRCRVLSRYKGFADAAHYAAERRLQGRAGPLFPLKVAALRVLLLAYRSHWLQSLRVMVQKDG